VREFQCSVASAARREPMFATASQVRGWLLVEIRGSWGRDSVTNTDLARHVTNDWRQQMRSAGLRVVAIRRDLDRASEQSIRLVVVRSGLPGGSPGTIWRHDVASLHAVVEATRSLPTDGADTANWRVHHEPLILVCTNGRHDSCCASFGRPVVRSLRDSSHADTVWECSHIGGDRFAGNIVALPEGFYFGRCTADSGLDVVNAYRRGVLLLDHYRGRSTLRFTFQAAEYFARRALDLTAIDAVSAVRRLGDPANGKFAIDVAGFPPVSLTIRRHVDLAPSALTCAGPDDVKLPRYELVEIDAGATAVRSDGPPL
jgi:hypothetical protein